MTWLEKLERHHSNLQFHDLGVNGMYAVTQPDDRRIAIVTERGRVILSRRMVVAICTKLPSIMDLFCKP